MVAQLQDWSRGVGGGGGVGGGASRERGSRKRERVGEVVGAVKEQEGGESGRGGEK